MKRLALLLTACLLALGVASTETAAASAAASCPRAPSVAPATRSETPVVLVHGWTGDTGDFKKNLTPFLTKRFGKRVHVYSFDYHEWSTAWPDDPHISACLASFIHRITDPAKRPAVVVAHSMGGLAIRFAGSPAYVKNPITSKQVSHVVTLDTPALGSPWGGSALAGLQSTKADIAINKLRQSGGLPAKSGNAWTCLAPQQQGKPVPGCPVAPYLPKHVSITTIEGSVTVDRKLFGATLYSVGLYSDAIVPVSSSRTYVNSGPTGTSPVSPGLIHSRQVKCSVPSTSLYGPIEEIPGVGLVPLLANTFGDKQAMADLEAGKVTATNFLLLAAAQLQSKVTCNHSTILHNNDAMRITADEVEAHLLPDSSPPPPRSSSSLKVGAFTMALPAGYKFDRVSSGPVIGVAAGPDGSPDQNPNNPSQFRVLLAGATSSEGRYDTTWVPEECFLDMNSVKRIVDDRKVTIAGHKGLMNHFRYTCTDVSYSWVVWETELGSTRFSAEYIWTGPDRGVKELTSALAAATWRPEL